MHTRHTHNFKKITGNFTLHGSFISATPYGTGHINDTYAVNYDQGGTKVRYILQRINHNIFKDVEGLMDNIHRVTEHQNRKLEADNELDASRRALKLIPVKDGHPFHKDESGNYWRMYIFVEHATGHDLIKNPAQAEAAAHAFGVFQQLLVDLPGAPLIETIPGFHDTPARFAALVRAIEADTKNRAAHVKDAIDFAYVRQTDTERLLTLHRNGKIPSLVTHNDTKLNNVLIDNATGVGICVIDLDTVMPGLALCDFGDMVRTATNSAPEDEPDVANVHMRMPIFEALARGYIITAGAFLSPAEIELLPFSGKLLTLECGIRFLTDYLEGDNYFKTHHPEQNIDRCRCQFALVRSIEENEDAMRAVVEKIY